ncbi:hypothetical protein [Gracilimonas mengyeensis]|uniref:Alcohol dehydrogenase GroES-like domain-containing protein n=1 Tax=Gracilimonas mengyeensis TaxID=1302730 RepID=A0A521DYF1_9BACT|nr:hypothetical protein [Gracilimonas mengyeensis]SMO76101.1 hypothetical protein SAMN06265219_109176 [Gracilimonas mengyeensis]
MKAAVHYTYGDEKVLQFEDLPNLLPAENELLIKVVAVTVNRTDCAYLTGKPVIMH